jgi:hypothetical protein
VLKTNKEGILQCTKLSENSKNPQKEKKIRKQNKKRMLKSATKKRSNVDASSPCVKMPDVVASHPKTSAMKIALVKEIANIQKISTNTYNPRFRASRNSIFSSGN